MKEEDILDLPEQMEEAPPDYKVLRFAALACFLLALVARFDDWPYQAALILTGTLLFLLWSVLRFMGFRNKKAYEYFYFPARLLLVSGLAIRYLSYWKYDQYLVYTSLSLFLIGFIVSMRDR